MCDTYDYAPVCLGSLPVTSVASPNLLVLENIQESFVNEGNTDINYLLFYGTATNTYLDNFIATRNCINADFDVENNCPSITFIPELTGDEFMHDWDFGDGSTSTESSPIHTYLGNGSYEVIHTITDDCGNMSTSTQTVEIDCSSAFSCPCSGST